MPKKVLSGTILMLLLMGMSTFALNIRSVKSKPKTWTVDDDGPAGFHTIQEAINAANNHDTIYIYNGTYQEKLILNKTLSLIGENKDSTIIESVGNLDDVLEVTADDVLIANFTIKNGFCGLDVYGGGVLIFDNKILYNTIGVCLQSSHCSIFYNEIKWNDVGIDLLNTHLNTIYNNTIEQNNWIGICIECASEFNLMKSNTISSNSYLPFFEDICGGIFFHESSNNKFVNNNIVNNKIQVNDRAWNHSSFTPSVNVWDDGYISRGNYWENHASVDLYSGPYQNETGSDGVSDNPFIIDVNNLDKYPLTKPYPWAAQDLGITGASSSKTTVGRGFDLQISLTIFNYGINTENFNVTTYANTTVIQTENITLSSRNSTTLTFTWNTTGFPLGNYTISAAVDNVPSETDTADNTLTYGIITITIPGDFNIDFKVGLSDFTLLEVTYGSTPWQSGTMDPWNPNCDVNSDNKVGPYDFTVLSIHYGEHYP